MPQRKNAEELVGDPRRARIHRRLLLIGDGPAAFYRDACRILDTEIGLSPQVIREPSEREDAVQTPPLRLVAAAHLVSHLFREIESAVRQVLLPDGAQIEKDNHKAEIDAILSVYELDQDATLVEAWHRLTGNGEWSLHRRAHRDNLARPRALNDSTRRYFSDIEAVLDAVLSRFEERFADMLEIVDELVAKHPPTKSDLKLFRKRVPNNLITQHHFFSRITDPAWLDLLARDGTFTTPPEPMLDEEDATAYMQPWPAGQYLARMAAVPEIQDRVAEIAQAVPSTQNVRVHEDLADAALALPVALALQVVDRAKTWCGDPWFSRIGGKIGGLIERFLGAGEIDAALQLAEALFDPENRSTSDLESGHEAWAYEQSLRKLAPLLVEAGGLRALETLASCLVKLLQGGRRSARENWKEFSYIWRPAIETHEQNPSHRSDARQALIDAVRDGAEAICVVDPSQIGLVVQHLESIGSPVLDRIALHLLRVAPDVPVDLVASRLFDRDRLYDHNVWHEYTLLARSRLGDLGRDEQSQIVRWAVERELRLAMDAGPNDEGDVEDPEARNHRARAFEHGALERFHGVLPDEFRARHEELQRELGSTEHPEFLAYHGEVRMGSTSPKTAEELQALPVDELITYLKVWTPEFGPMSPSREGLARELRNVVAAESERFAGVARSFREVHSSYVRSVISGLVDVARGKKGFDWKPVLDLCAWAVEQDTPTRSDEELADAGEAWAGVRSEVARLLEYGFQDGAQELPLEFREQAWAIVEQLSSDPDPTPERESEYNGSNASAYELAINTTRGSAVAAAIQYGLWVRRHLDEPPPNFDSIPELRSLLETHLKPLVDPSLAVRSVYGRWLPWIHLLDPAWTSMHIDRIFPAMSALNDLRQAAWSAYILYCQPHDDVFRVLHREYRHAVSELGQPDERSRWNPEERLAEHLMVFYLRGQVDLQDELLAGFFDRATGALRQHAMDFVGRVLYDNGDLEATIKARATALWESRTADLDAAGADGALEVAAFGWWFAASSLDERWRIAQLERVLSMDAEVEPDHLVLDHFVVLISRYPLPILACVRRMIEGASDRWKTFSWREELRKILEAALRGESPDAVRDARAIVNLLVARGETEYRTLLDSST